MYPFMSDFNNYLSSKKLSNNTIKKYNTTIQTFAIYVENEKKLSFQNYKFEECDLISYQKFLFSKQIVHKNVQDRISKIKNYIQFLIMYKKINISPLILNLPILKDNSSDNISLLSPTKAFDWITDNNLKFESRLIILCITLGMPLTDICSVYAFKLLQQKECPSELVTLKQEFINIIQSADQDDTQHLFKYKYTSKYHRANAPVETTDGLQNIIRSDSVAIGRYLSIRNLRKDLTLYDLFYNKSSIDEVALKYQCSISKISNYYRLYRISVK